MTEKDKAESYSENINPEDFVCLSKLGSGGFGDVVSIKKTKGDNQGKIYAMKTVFNKNFMYGNSLEVKSEKSALLDCNDYWNISQMLYFFKSSVGFHIILKYYPGGSLSSYLMENGCLYGMHLKVFIAEVVMGLSVLHSKDWVHGDLHVANILIDEEGHAVIADLGTAFKLNTEVEDKKLAGMWPSWYLKSSFEFDIGRLGYLCHDAATIKKGSIFKTNYIQVDPKLPTDLHDLISKMLQDSDRITMNAIRAHEYLKGIEWSSIQQRSGIAPFPRNFIQSLEVNEEFKNDSSLLDYINRNNSCAFQESPTNDYSKAKQFPIHVSRFLKLLLLMVIFLILIILLNYV